MSLEELHLNLRNLTSDDYGQLKSLMDAVYHDIGGAWPKHTIDKLIQEFPDGQIAIEDDGVKSCAARLTCAPFSRAGGFPSTTSTPAS